MKINDNTLYVLALGKEKYVFDTEEEAIKTLRNDMGNDVDAESVSIFEVNIESEEWSIQQVPWSKIALELIQEEG